MYPGVPLQLRRGGAEQRGPAPARPAEVLLLPGVRPHTRAVARAAHRHQARLLLSLATIYSSVLSIQGLRPILTSYNIQGVFFSLDSVRGL